MCQLALVVSVAAVSIPAVAEDTAEEVAQSKEHARRAKTQYERGNYEAALAEYKLAYSVLQLPGLLFNQAQCHRLLGQHAKALALYERYLGIEPSSAAADEARGYLPVLRVRVARQEEEERVRKDAIAREQAAREQAEARQRATAEEEQPSSRRKPPRDAWDATFEQGYRAEGITTVRQARDYSQWYRARKARGVRLGVHFAFGFGMPAGFRFYVPPADRRVDKGMLGAQIELGGLLRTTLSPRWDFVSRLTLAFQVGSHFSSRDEELGAFGSPAWAGALLLDGLFRVHPHRAKTYPYFGFGARVGVGFTSVWYQPDGASDYSKLKAASFLVAPQLELGGIVGEHESWDVGFTTSIGGGGPGWPLYVDVVLRMAYAIK